MFIPVPYKASNKTVSQEPDSPGVLWRGPWIHGLELEARLSSPALVLALKEGLEEKLRGLIQGHTGGEARLDLEPSLPDSYSRLLLEMPISYSQRYNMESS